MKSKAKPGYKAKNISLSMCTPASKLWVMTSRQQPTQVWVEETSGNTEPIKLFAKRDKTDMPDAMFLDHGDVVDHLDTLVKDHWHVDGAKRKYLERFIPIKQGQVGEPYPPVDELAENFSMLHDGACEARTRPHAHAAH